MKLTIGRIVIYKTTESQRTEMELNPVCKVHEELPAMIVGIVDKNYVNLKVFCDGEHSLHVTAKEGKGENEWKWPEIKK